MSGGKGLKKTSAEGQTLNDLKIKLFKSVQIVKLASKLGILSNTFVFFSVFLSFIIITQHHHFIS